MNKIVFKSKIGLELTIPLILLFGSVIYLAANDGQLLTIMLILMPVLLFIIYLFTSTEYIIEGQTLEIKSGFVFRKKVDVKNIIKIKETNNPISSPAASLDRLNLSLRNGDSVIISPKLKIDFIKSLLEINPDLEVNLKKRS